MLWFPYTTCKIYVYHFWLKRFSRKRNCREHYQPDRQDSIHYSEMEDALGRYFRVLDADMQRPAEGRCFFLKIPMCRWLDVEKKQAHGWHHKCPGFGWLISVLRFASLHEILRDAADAWRTFWSSVGRHFALLGTRGVIFDLGVAWYSKVGWKNGTEWNCHLRG